MELRFTTDLPPGAKLANERLSGGKNINKAEVESQLRSNPGQWALVYESTNVKTIQDWKRREGIEVAREQLPNQQGIVSSNKKYKVWLRWVGVPGQPGANSLIESGLPSEPVEVADEAESVPAAPVAPPKAPTPPAPLAPLAAPMPPPQTAFQKAWQEQQEGTSDPMA